MWSWGKSEIISNNGESVYYLSKWCKDAMTSLNQG